MELQEDKSTTNIINDHNEIFITIFRIFTLIRYRLVCNKKNGSMKRAYILSATRTPIGSFGGVFKDIEATELGAMAIKGALQLSNIDPDYVEEVFMGNVVSANLGQAPARQASLKAGLANTSPCT